MTPEGVTPRAVSTSPVASARTWLTLVAAVGCCYGVASAQTFYKWTDDHGTVHFSDVPPAGQTGVEERSLPPPPEPLVNSGSAEKPQAESAGEAPEGPARIILVSRDAPRTGPQAVHVSGEVKNVGGAEARGVSVIVSAVDVTAGTPCLRETVDVAPATLRPGESGRFDAEIDNPCLAGNTPVDITTSSE